MNEPVLFDIQRGSTVDGPGFRTAVYAAGCTHRCPDCHNPQSWDIHAGHIMDIEDILTPIMADPLLMSPSLEEIL